MRYTPGSSNSRFQDLVIDFQRLFHTIHEFENRTFVWVRLIFFLFSSISFDCRSQSNSIHELSSIEFDWVRLKFSSVGFDLLCRGVGNKKW